MNPKVLRAAERAIAKASSLRPTAQAWTHGDGRVWSVVSATTGEVYQVYRYTVAPKIGSPWWDYEFCTCPAAEAGYFVCWHKALVHLLRNDGLEAVG